MNIKIKWLRDILKTQNLQGMIVSNPVNIKYLTGIEAEGVFLITLKENFFITDSRYVEAVNTILTIEDEILVHDKKNLSREDYASFFMFCENVGFEENYATYEQYKNIKQRYKANNLVETEGIIEKQRIVKDEEEINKIRKACEITDNCFTHLLSYIKTGMTEKQIALEIEMYFKTHGADGVSFEPIVAIGENSSIPHWIPGNRKVEMADPILIDMGCKYEGYCSDMTRTIFMGCILEEIKPVYDLALKNLELSTKEITDGYTIKTAANMVESDFKVNGYNLIHALGHGVGLEVHELPFIRLKNEANFKENMVIADEPGIYLPGKYGIRIEDTLLVTKDGSERLTKSERGYVVI